MTHTPLSVVFFGTQTFASTILEGISADSRFNVIAVVTQPDRPTGRKKIMTAPPVKILAINSGIQILQPESLKNFNMIAEIGVIPDLNIVAQYGLLIPEAIINAPRFKTINVHTSLLPAYRGASPIQSALVNGDTETGVTIMLMDKGVDTGPILAQKKVTIDPDILYPELERGLAAAGNELLAKTIPDYIDEKTVPRLQNENEATHCNKLDRESGRIQWTQSAREIYNRYRGFHPWPGIWTTLNNSRIKLLKVAPVTMTIAPGHIKTENNRLFVGCGESALEIFQLQREGKSAQSAESFIAGYAPNNQNFI